MKTNYHYLKEYMLTLLLICSGVIMTFGQTNLTSDRVEQGKVHVKFEPSMSQSLTSMKVSKQNGIVATGFSGFDAVASQYRATEIKPMFIAAPGKEEAHRRHGLDLWYEITIDRNSNVLNSVRSFGQVREVAIAEPVYTKNIVDPAVEAEISAIAPSALPMNDPGLAQQWHYENDGTNGGIVEADINLFAAWQTTTGNPNVIVAVHDLGVDVNHEDLAANMWVNEAELNGQPGVDDDYNGYVDDIHGFNFVSMTGDIPAEDHGTHVAGTIAAVNNNGIGVSGVAGGSGNGDGARIMSLKTLGGSSNVGASYVYAADNGAVISQNSWTYTSPNVYEQSVLDGIDYFIAEAGNYPGSPMRGGIVIFAAGNYNRNDTYYPEAYDAVLSVASLGRTNEKAYYSNYAPWVDVAAPGGDQSQRFGNSGGVLSTLPNNNYGFFQGTSMACPHVSGVAALIVSANGGSTFTNNDAWTHILTGTHDIYEYNPSYGGLLGVGYVDAALAIKRNEGIGPDQITDFEASNISQDFVEFIWTTVGDQDDETVFGYEIYYGENSQHVAQNAGATKTKIIANKSAAGTILSESIEDLIPETTYYFAISAFDRWGNRGNVSNIVEVITTAAPSIGFDKQSITFNINTASNTAANDVFNVVNGAEGALKWRAEVRQTKAYRLSTTAVNYPISSVNTPKGVTMVPVEESLEIAPSDYDNNYTTKKWRDGAGPGQTSLYVIGDEDLTIPNSAAKRYVVSDPNGFNLTKITQRLRHNRTIFPDAVLEIYVGETMDKKNLVHAQNFVGYSDDVDRDHGLVLYGDPYEQQQIFLETGDVFWVVYHIPAGIQYPLGIGRESSSEQSDNCYMSFDVGKTWVPLAEAIGDDRWVWYQELESSIQPIHDYITLTPTEGVTPGNDQQTISVDVDASQLINGNYYAQATFYSNDDANRVAEVDFTVNVSGHQPNLASSKLVNFGSTFVGVPLTMEIPMSNSGLGVFRFNKNSCTSSNADYSFGASNAGIPTRVDALDSDVLTITFTPSTAGNINSTLTLVDYNGNSHVINVSGVGMAPSEIDIPVNSADFTMAIGEIQSGSFDIVNNGDYPLEYYLPRYEDKEGILLVSSNQNTFGYTWERSSDAGATITYDWEDISATGVDITNHWASTNSTFYEADLGFEFPLFNRWFEKLYVTEFGVITTHTNIGIVGNGINIGSPYQNVQISSLNKKLRLEYGGNVYVQRKSGKFIVQYENVRTSSSSSTIWTFQTIIYDNGDVVINYKDVPSSAFNARAEIAVEDPDKKFGFMAYDEINSTPAPSAALVDLTSIKVSSPGVNALENFSSTYGIIPVGSSETITFDVNATNLIEGSWYQKLMVASNDPANPYSTFSANINVNSGGIADVVMSENAIDFGSIFQGKSIEKVLEIKNNGTKAITINDAVLSNGNFDIVHDGFPFELKPRSTYFITISHTGDVQGTFNDVLTFDLSDASTPAVDLSIVVGPAPAIDITTSAIDYSLNVGESVPHVMTISNSGAVDLDYSVAGTEWAYFNDNEAAATSVNISDFDYAVRTKFDESGVTYNWNELIGNGEQLDDGNYSEWHIKELPFAFNYYGNTYQTIYIHSNGIISFDDYTDVELGFNDVQATMPNPSLMNNVLAPFWFRGHYRWYDNVEDRYQVGVFYKEYEDHVIVEYANMASPQGAEFFSTQAIIYKNGNIKFQYNVTDTRSRMNFGTVGIENIDGTVGKQLVGFDIYLEDKTAILFTPSNKRILAAGQSVDLNMTIDANNILDGIYTSNINIESNVPGNEISLVPASLDVTGMGELTGPTEVNFGDIVAEQLPNGNPETHSTFFILKNSGTAPVTITSGSFLNSTGYFSVDHVTIVCGRFCNEVVAPVDGSYTTIIEPGASLELRATLNTELANYEAIDELVLTTDGVELMIPLYANVYLPPVLDVNTAPIHYEASSKDFTDNTSIVIDNTAGQSELIYDLSLDYNRSGATMAQAMTGTYVDAELVNSNSAIVQGTSMAPSVAFNNELSYGTDDVQTYAGFGEAYAFSSSTKFYAPAEGFTLSHVTTGISTESSTSTRLIVEVYAGADIYNAVKLGATEYIFESVSGFLGDVTIPLDEAIALYPYEAFYVTIRYPFGIKYPQAINTAGVVPNTFLYQYGAFWYDAQASFADGGWYVRAQEETYGETGWIELSSAGSVPAGSTSSIDLSVFAANMLTADVAANIVINSNDPYNPSETIAVSMHLNQAPTFADVNTTYYVNETETLEFNLSATDAENESITMELINAPATMAIADLDGSATITYTPDYEEAGTYNFDVQATDSNGGSTLFNVTVEVTDVNRTPEFFAVSDLTLNIDGGNHIINSADVFTDADMDELTIRVTNTDASIVNASASSSQFIITPSSEGTTVITLFATDNRSSEISTSFTVSVIGESNLAPTTHAMSDMELTIDYGTYAIAGGDVFTDTEGDVLNYFVENSNSEIATVAATAEGFMIMPKSIGSSSITLLANDGFNEDVSVSFILTVTEQANVAPVSFSVADMNIYMGDPTTILEVSNVFTDADNDALSITVNSSNESVASVTYDGSQFGITPVGFGSTTITLEATDGKHDPVTVSFLVNVDYVLSTNQDHLVEWNVYPNPVVEVLNISSPESGIFNLRIISANGSIMIDKQIDLTNDRMTSLDISNFTEGMYLIELSNGSAKATQRILKK